MHNQRILGSARFYYCHHHCIVTQTHNREATPHVPTNCTGNYNRKQFFNRYVHMHSCLRPLGLKPFSSVRESPTNPSSECIRCHCRRWRPLQYSAFISQTHSSLPGKPPTSAFPTEMHCSNAPIGLTPLGQPTGQSSCARKCAQSLPCDMHVGAG